jgi:hypothetical protein
MSSGLPASEGEADVEAGLEQEVRRPPVVLRLEGGGYVGRDGPEVERDRRLEEQAVQHPEVVADPCRKVELQAVIDLLVLCVVITPKELGRADRRVETLRQRALVGKTNAALAHVARIGLVGRIAPLFPPGNPERMVIPPGDGLDRQAVLRRELVAEVHLIECGGWSSDARFMSMNIEVPMYHGCNVDAEASCARAPAPEHVRIRKAIMGTCFTGRVSKTNAMLQE